MIERQDKNGIFSSFITRYKAQYYYWECIIFIRRICIAMFSVSINDNTHKMIFICIIFFFYICNIDMKHLFVIKEMKWNLFYCHVLSLSLC